jgi:hypothetical protein
MQETQKVDVQKELEAARAEVLQKEAELELVREQNREITEELAWVVKDLLRLKKKDNDDRCQSWLLSSQGLSTVLAKRNCESVQEQGVSSAAACMSATLKNPQVHHDKFSLLCRLPRKRRAVRAV